MKVFVTKYALTKGIQEVNGEVSAISPSISMFCGPGFHTFHGEGKEWHRTREAAVKRAEAMRVAKIVSLQKSIDFFEKMRFL